MNVCISDSVMVKGKHQCILLHVHPLFCVHVCSSHGHSSHGHSSHGHSSHGHNSSSSSSSRHHHRQSSSGRDGGGTSSSSSSSRSRQSTTSSRPPGDEVYVGKYKLVKTIGKGNFAKVKLAKHMPTGQEVCGYTCNTQVHVYSLEDYI